MQENENLSNDLNIEDELGNLSVDQINDFFGDIVKIPNEAYILASAATGKGCHNPPIC